MEGEKRPTTDQGAGTATELGDLNADVVTEILLRLPSASSVVRCGAVCRAWRSITSGPGFVAAYARRRPLELVVQRHGANGVLDTIPLATLDEASRRRCLHPGYPRCEPPGLFTTGYSLVASCVDGGLLLFERLITRGRGHLASLYLVCDPVRRQWAVVPLHSDKMTRPCALYLHRPSGEHRLLLLANDDECYGWGQWASHYVRSLEAAETRRLQAPPVTGIYMSNTAVFHSLEHRGRLHWLDDHPEAKATGTVLAFDTVSETFRRMARPPPLRNDGGDDRCLCLLEVDGMVAVASILGGSMDVWVLQDYDDDDHSWAHRHQVHCLPPPFLQTRWVINANADSNNNDVIIALPDSSGTWVGLYDLSNKRLLNQIQVISNPHEDGIFHNSTHLNALLFRETIQRHSFFDLGKSILQFPDSDLV